MIEHVFVLMLENRSFDHILGFAGIRGIEAARFIEKTRQDYQAQRSSRT